MKNDKIVVGLDIGTTKVCAIVGRKNEFGKIDILGVGSAISTGVSRGMVSNIPKTVEAIEAAVTQAKQRSNIDIKKVQVGIAGWHIKSTPNHSMLVRSNMETEINQDDLDRLTADMHKISLPADEQIIHIIPQDYTVDGEGGIKDPIGMAGLRLEGNFHIITGNVNAARNIYKCVTKAGLVVEDMILEPLASADAVLTEEELEAGVALVDIGGGTTDMAIFHDGIIRHTAIIPFGGAIITDDIHEGCSVMRNQAEKLKVLHGSAIPEENRPDDIIVVPGLRDKSPKEISVRNLASIIHARVEEIFNHVNYEIKASGLEKKLIGGIVLTGGGAQLKHLPQLVEYLTGLDVRVGYPNEHLAKGMVDEVKSPMFATGIGLVIKGLNNGKTDSNYELTGTTATVSSPSSSFWDEPAPEPVIQQQQEDPQPKETDEPKPKKSGMFSSLVESFRGLLDDEELKDYRKDKP